MTDSKINALITLLGDEDASIRKVAGKKLLERGDGIIPLLREIGREDSEGLLRIEAQILLEENRLKQLTENFKKLNKSASLDLEEACFILAQIEYPDLKVPHYIKLIDDLAAEAREAVAHHKTRREQIDALSVFLYKVKGFKGNSDAYYDPQNSYINRVLDRRKGIPISLSAIYLFIAKRLELPVEGVGFPGHFLLKCHTDTDTFFIDAFNNGTTLTRNDCKTLLNKMGYRFYDFYLQTATQRDILSRMIRNLVLIYLENNQQKKIETVERIFSDFIME